MNVEAARLFQELLDASTEERARIFAERSVAPEVRDEVESLLSYDRDTAGRIEDIVQYAVGASFGEENANGEQYGAYRLIRILGRGGMGQVYLAERSDGEVSQQVAIKVLRTGVDSERARQWFRQERQILANLTHPCIARLLDAGHTAEGEPYLVMEYIDGEPLDSFAAKLPIRERVELLAKVCDAVAYAHRKLVVHRDLKPANILVDRDGTPKLLDFGVAKLVDDVSDATVTVERRLTPHYASPEQILGKAVGTPTDIFSLGAVIRQVLSGGVGMMNPPIAHSAGKDLDAIVRVAMREEPEARYSSADRLADDLRAWLEHRPVQARHGGWWYLARRYGRRYWPAVVAAAVAFVSLTAGLMIARHERDIAQKRFEEVRNLATELFTIEGDIQKLSGSGTARERIVQTALNYLERLSREARGDVDLQSEIGVGYRKVADIQGGFRRLNLGKPAEALASLHTSEEILRKVLQSHPNDPRAIRNLIESVESESRIQYGEKKESEMIRTLDELKALMSRYEPLAPATPDEWDFLGSVCETISIGSKEAGRLEDAMKSSERSLDYQRRAAATNDTPRLRSHLASSLGAYVRMLRAEGDLDGALRNAREGLALQERLTRENPEDYRGRINLATDYNTIGLLIGEADGISLRKLKEAIPWMLRAREEGRAALDIDPSENQTRYNLALVCWRLGNILKAQDPARALSIYNESIELLRDMPKKSGTRDLPLSYVLAESTFPLRTLSMVPEAQRRLEEARKLAAEYKISSIGMPAEAISRAEAQEALDSKRPLDAAKIHEAWLTTALKDPKAARDDLRNAVYIAERYSLLRSAYEAAGQRDKAAECDRKRRELLETWRQRPKSRAFAEQLLK